MFFLDVEALHHNTIITGGWGNDTHFFLISVFVFVSLKGAIVVLMLRADHAAEIFLR